MSKPIITRQQLANPNAAARHRHDVEQRRASVRDVEKTERRSLEQRLAAAEQKTADERAAREKAEHAAATHRMLAGSPLDAVARRRVENLVESERQRCVRSGAAFDQPYEVMRLEHAERVRAGVPAGVAPSNPRGEPMHPNLANGTKPETFDARMASRAAYQEALRRYGLTDPAMGSIPGGGGPLNGGG